MGPSPAEWHSENLKTNAHHYSFLRVLGPEAIARIQGSAARLCPGPDICQWVLKGSGGVGAWLWFNPNVDLGGRAYKYGVISAEDLMAGRGTNGGGQQQ